MKVISIRFLVCLVIFSASAAAQKKEFTNDQLLKGARTGITYPLPQFMGWVDDNRFLLNKKVHPDSPSVLLVIDCKTGKDSPGSTDMLPADNKGDFDAYIKSDDIYIREGKNAERKLTETPEKEINPVLSPDHAFVAFTRNSDLYTINLASGKETRLTSDGSDVILNGYASWVYYEEILGRPTRYRSFWWSPDSKAIAFMRMDDSSVPIFPIYVETGRHGYLENTHYPKSGDRNPEVRVGMVSPEGGQVTWAAFNEKDDQYFGMPYWRPDGKALWVQWMNRGQDTLKIFEVSLSDGSKKEIYTEQQKTWINLDDEGERIRFLEKGGGFILQSDRDGWDNLYQYDMNGRLVNKITSGNFWSTSIIRVDEDKKTVFFTARRENSTRSDFYRVNLDGKGLQRLSFGDYTHRIFLSPGGSYFVTQHSNTATPDRLALADTKVKVIRQLGDSKGPGFEEYNIAKTEILRIKSEDGLFNLPIRITWPLNYDSSQRYPVLISIYGGPNAGTVRDGWQFSGQQQWWAREGLIQVTMDHRGSGHFGKEGINYMHRNLGNWELKDWISIVKWLRAHGADSARIGISGFSYGGYMTCLALTAGAGYFTHGLAGGSVTDWQLYDTHYTERFMDRPEENPEGYKKGSVLNYTDKYKGLLRIYHGTMDDNVHMQNSIQLVRKLQEGKKHFEFMLYPGGRHGWGGNSSVHSTNENNLFIYKNLLRKEMPKEMWR
jgi:dipeptidyl-peptidase-4